MKNPLVSVIVPCYNQAQYLDECLESVLNQTYSNWECIIVNDGSPDNTDEIAAKWCKTDVRFRYSKKTNGGLSSARNMGLKTATGDYIQFLDSDDILTNNKFELQLNILKKANYDVIVSDYAYILKKNLVRKHDAFNYDFSLNGLIYGWDISFIIPIHTTLVSKSFLANHNIFFSETLKAKEDYMFWIKCSFKGAKFYYHNDVLAYYRQHNSSLTRNNKNMIIYIYKVFLEVYELLDEKQREIYMDKMPSILLDKTISLFDKIFSKESKSYKLGAFLLFFPKLIKKFVKKAFSVK